MKILFLIYITLHSLVSFGSELFEVLDRSEVNYSSFYKNVYLDDLTSDNSFEGKYFKIVLKKSNQAIKFENQELKLKAATVYYHLTKARNFWIRTLGSNYVKTLSQIVVRLDITNQFDDLGHFANDKKLPQFNNALTIPSGETPSWVPTQRKDKWGIEIWFRPKKNIHYSEFPLSEPNPLTTILETLESPYLQYEQGRFIRNIIQQIFFPNETVSPFWVSMIRFAGTFTLAKSIIKSSRKLDPLFMHTWYYLDSAMVPEIIYHEFSHVALSDHLELSHSTPVNEGFADYFAAILTNKSKVYHEVEGYSNSAPKDTQNRSRYIHWLEANHQATSDFVLSLLWDIRNEFGTSSDKIIFNARSNLSTEFSSINKDMLKAILESCKMNCDHPRSDRLILFKIFSSRGL